MDIGDSAMLALAIAGIYRLKKELGRIAFLPVFISVILFGVLYATMGEKTDWKWIRYASLFLPIYIMLIAGGVFSSFFRSRKLSVPAAMLAVFLFIPGIVRWADNDVYNRSNIPRLASRQLAMWKPNLNGFILISPWWVPRPVGVATFSFFRTDGLPTYILHENELMFIDPPTYVVGAPPPKGEPADAPAPGRYLVYNWVAWYDGRSGVDALIRMNELTKNAVRDTPLSEQVGFEIYEFK